MAKSDRAPIRPRSRSCPDPICTALAKGLRWPIAVLVTLAISLLDDWARDKLDPTLR